MKLVIVIAAVLLSVSTTAQAVGVSTANEPDEYEANQAEIELLRTVLHAKRKAVIANTIEMSEIEKQAFWPTYHEYRVATRQVKGRLVKLIFEYADLYKSNTLTDKKALRLVDRFLTFQHEMIRVKRSYLKNFKKVLPAKKVLRFYQLDNRLDTIDLLEISQGVPLFE